LGSTYKVVLRIDNAAGGAATAWLNPSIESDPSFTPTDTKFIDPWQTFAFRQTTSGGTATTELIDNLMVGTTFGDVVVPEPSTVLLVAMGMLGLFAARRRRS
jgi:hypothetical protein